MKKDRHIRIMEILEENTICTPKELADTLNCSEMTIRRDLAEMEQINLINRKYGCAYLKKATRPVQFYEQEDEHIKEKEAIAKVAVSMIKPYMIIGIDSGTTTYALTRMLPSDMPVSVVTPNLLTAVELSPKENIQVYMPGGVMWHRSCSVMISDTAELANHICDVAFLACRACKIPGGIYEQTYPLVDSKRALAANAKKVVLLADHNKFEHTALCNCIPLSDIDTIITDKYTPIDILKKAAALNTEVIVVDPDTDRVVKHFQ